MAFTIQEEEEFQFIDEGQGETLLLLHGLFGALSNWDEVINGFKDKYRVIIPLMPIYEMPLRKAGIPGLTDFIERFVELKKLDNFSLIGNSLGGHISLVYILRHPEKVKHLILTGSSGLYENSMGSSFPKRGDYAFIQEKVGYTFYDPKIATKDLIDHVFETTKSNLKCLRIIAIAKSAQRHNMAEEVTKITVPSLLVWGLNDTITPPFVAHEFNRLIPNATLRFIDKCCHAPMMERPTEFNKILRDFLEKN